ncbi:MAG: von Willebrand factor type A domain-containing protein [Verrucomicrobiota bacterium]
MPTDPDKNQPQDDATDALLREHARAGTTDDETFLARVEAALDADQSKITPLPEPAPRKSVARFITVAAVIAILVAVGIQFFNTFQALQTQTEIASSAQLEQEGLNTRIALLTEQLDAAKKDLVTRGEAVRQAALAQNDSQSKISNLESELAKATEEATETRRELEKWSATMAKLSGTDIAAVEKEISRLRQELAATKKIASITIGKPATPPATSPSPKSIDAIAHTTAGPAPTIATGIALQPNSSSVTLGADASMFGGSLGGVVRQSGFVAGNAAGTQLGRGYGDLDSYSVALRRKGEADAFGFEARIHNPPPTDRERYGQLIDNRWDSPFDYPLSTFSIDVDTASYTNLRRMINDRAQHIPPDAVRIEELINYFNYNYPYPESDDPFAFAIETAQSPWNKKNRLVRIGLQAEDMDRDSRPPANLTFLLDVSGSMKSADKLPLVIESMKMLTKELRPDDQVAIAVYAGAEGLVLKPTPISEKRTILNALKNLSAGGSTNGGAGIELAYRLATDNFMEDGINRVILCTDGDFNVGTTVQGDLVDLVEERAQGGVFLSVLGFGTGNINDAMLEAITNKGNGTYYYIDSIDEARKVFLEDLMSTLVTVAKDVKIQVEFNPAKVQSYRLIGYANRMLEAEDFEDDTVDAGEVGAGHRVTALYEIVPVPKKKKDGNTKPDPDSPFADLKYQRVKKVDLLESDDLLTVKLRYKEPDGDTSKLIEIPVADTNTLWRDASEDFQFASAVALFGMILRNSEYCGDAGYENVLEIAAHGTGKDPKSRRQQFRDLVRQHAKSAPRPVATP